MYENAKPNAKIKLHIPYRDSKLTHLLREGLGGNSKLIIVGCISEVYSPETINTLNFVTRAKETEFAKKVAKNIEVHAK